MRVHMLFLYVVICCSVDICHGENSKNVCEFKNLNALHESAFPTKITRMIRCCDRKQCGGLAIHVNDSGSDVGQIVDEWFINRTLTNNTAYLIKKRHSRIFQTPETAGTSYSLPRNLTEAAELSVWITPFQDFEQLTIRLQSDRYNHVLYMQPDSFLEDVTLQCLLQDEFGCANRSWGSSIIAGLDPFPFSAEEQVKITFRHVVNAIEIKIDGVAYLNFTSDLPLEWITEVKFGGDTFINRMEFLDTFMDEVDQLVVV